MFDHHRHHGANAASGHDGDSARYQVPVNLLAKRGQTRIEDESGGSAFHVHGHVTSVPHSLVVADAAGNELLRILDLPAGGAPAMEIQDAGAGVSATVEIVPASVSDRLLVDLHDGSWLEVEGDLPAHEYVIQQGGTALALVSTQGVTAADAYGVEVSAGQAHALILAITVCIDRMAAR